MKILGVLKAFFMNGAAMGCSLLIGKRKLTEVLVALVPSDNSNLDALLSFFDSFFDEVEQIAAVRLKVCSSLYLAHIPDETSSMLTELLSCPLKKNCRFFFSGRFNPVPQNNLGTIFRLIHGHSS